MDKDLIATQQLQTALIHSTHRSFGRFDFTALVENAGPVGGDLAGFFTIRATHIGFYIADVSGHDISAAMLTVRIASFFRPRLLAKISPYSALKRAKYARTNRMIFYKA